MNWTSYYKGFEAYLLLEKSLSPNSIVSYLSDLSKLNDYFVLSDRDIGPKSVESQDIQSFLTYIYELGLSDKTQARILSGIKAFFKYLLIENIITLDPTELIEGPKLTKKLPDVLSIEEVEKIIQSFDLSLENAQRNKAIIETLYSCGLRVSELTNLQISNIYFDEEFVRVIGKNNKERLIPIGHKALHLIQIYKDSVRKLQTNIKPSEEDILFLNRRGSRLSRVMIFNIIKRQTAIARINKTVSPHTFRHSFATHLVEGGADLRAVQEMLGHESITTTEIYTHLNTEYLRETIMKYHPSNRSN